VVDECREQLRQRHPPDWRYRYETGSHSIEVCYELRHGMSSGSVRAPFHHRDPSLNMSSERTIGVSMNPRIGKEAITSGQITNYFRHNGLTYLGRYDYEMCSDDDTLDEMPAKCSDPNFSVMTIDEDMSDITALHDKSLVGLRAFS
jgi:hypothetical protein